MPTPNIIVKFREKLAEILRWNFEVSNERNSAELSIQNLMEVILRDREAEIVAGIEGMKAWTVDYLVDGNRRDDLIAKNELIAKITKGEI